MVNKFYLAIKPDIFEMPEPFKSCGIQPYEDEIGYYYLYGELECSKE